MGEQKIYPDDSTLRVASLKIKKDANTPDEISRVLEDKPELDLIVTSEYSMWPGSYDETTPRIIIDCENKINDECQMQNIQNGDEIIENVNLIKNIAMTKNVNILVGTLPTQEEVSSLDPDLRQPLYNSIILIDRHGRIIDKKMKTKGSDWCVPAKNGKNDQCVGYGEIIKTSKKNAVTSSKTMRLTTKNNHEFTVFTSICLDLDDPEMIAQGAGSNADLLVWTTETGGDVGIEEIASKIHDGDLSVWKYVEESVIKPYVTKYNTIKKTGFFVVADPREAGIIDLKKNPLKELEVSENYVYGIIDLK